MTKVPLRVYNREIEGMIETGQLEEAIAHCQQILKTFPMCVETYRLLGKTFLEARKYGDAADIFQRALMAVPDDFVSHVGMSIIRDDEGKLDEAIWYMERAFEIQPSNSAIQGELRRLYGRRDGVEPPKIRLSRDALANMYSQGELFNQAIAEIRAVMADDPNRPDLQVMLARAYYRAGQKVEAAEMAATLLKKYPYCLDALRVLVDVLPGTGQGENTQIYRHRLGMVDPYSLFSTDSVFASDQVGDAAVTLEKLDYKPGATPASTQPEWAASLGIQLGSDRRTEGTPEWLRQGDAVEQPAQAGAEPSNPVGSTDAVPDWMQAAGWQKSSGASEEQPSEGFSTEPAPEPLAQAEIPDWLKSMAPAGVADLDSIVNDAESVPAVNSEGDVPDWLKAMAPAGGEVEQSKPANPLEAQPVNPVAEPASEGDVPDWLKAMAPTAGEAEPVKSAVPADTQPENPLVSPAEDGDVPDWLKAMAPTAGEAEAVQSVVPVDAQPENPIVSPAEEGDVPDWLIGMAPTGGEAEAVDAVMPADAQPETPVASPAEEGDVPAWLKSMAAEAAPLADSPIQADRSMPAEPVNVEPSPIEAGDVPDWLKGMAPAESNVKAAEVDGAAPVEAADLTPPQPQNIEAAPTEEGDIPDWLKSLAPAAAETTNVETPPDSMVLPGPEITPAGPQDVDSLDWLTGAPKTPAEKMETIAPPAEEPASPAAAEVEMPAWMGMASPQPPAAMQPPEDQVLPMGTAPEATSTEPSPEPGLPDWMTGAAVKPAEPAETVESQPVPGGTPPGGPSFEASSEIEMPDWLRASTSPLSTATSPAEPLPASPLASSEPVEPAPAGEFDMPDWLKSAAPPLDANPAPTGPVDFPAAPPPVEGQPMEEAPLPAGEADLPDWLKSMAPPAAAEIKDNNAVPSEPPAQVVEPEPAAEAAIPEWIKSLAPTTPAAGPSEPAPIEPPTPEPSAEPVSEADFPDWLKDLNVASSEARSQDIPPSEEVAAQAAPPEKAGEEVFPDWLNTIEPEAEKQSDLEDTRPTPTISLARKAEPMPTEAASLLEPEPVSPEALNPAPQPPAVAAEPTKAPEEGGFVPSGEVKPLEIADDTLGWLEALAAKQGAKPEELFTTPDQRDTQLPDSATETASSAPEAAETVQPEPASEPQTLEETTGKPPRTPLETLPLPSLDSYIKRDSQRQPLQTLPLTPLEILGDGKPITPNIPMDAATPPAAAATPPAVDKVPEVPQPEEPAQPVKSVSIEDDTMAWLERLAANQGAKQEELLSKPEDRPEAAPQWIQNAAAEQTATTAPPLADEQVPAPAVQPVPEQPTSLEQPVIVQPPAPVEPVASVSEDVPPDEPAQPETKEPESAQPPMEEDITVTTWLSALETEEIGLKAAAEETPATEQPVSQEELPDWLRDLEKPAIPETPQATVEPESDLPDWLRQPAEAPATPEKMEQEVEQPPVLQPLPELEPEEPMPAWMEEPEKPTAEAVPTGPEEWIPMEEVASTPAAEPVLDTTPPPTPVEEAPAAVEPASLETAVPTSGNLAPIPQNNKDAVSLSVAQAALEKNALNEAMKEYARLIKKGRLLDEVIHDLREATYRFPVDVIIWQTLGDAYMRANRLQDALDAYTKAEELLR